MAHHRPDARRAADNSKKRLAQGDGDQAGSPLM
jgi:hypothetical protein